MKSQNRKHLRSGRTVEVSVAPDGSIEINAVGFQGSDCEAATAFLEEALGLAGQRTRKPEYNQRSKVHQQQSLGSE